MNTHMPADAVAPRASLDRLLLDEFSHRTGNEIAAAIAAIRIARRMPGEAGRATLMEDAAGRLEAFGEVHRLLATREHGMVEAGDRLRRLCCALVHSRRRLAGVLTLDVPDVSLDASMSRCLLMVASELVSGSVRRALGSGGTAILVRLLNQRSRVVVTVADDVPGLAAGLPTLDAGPGRCIVRDLIARSSGRLDVRSGPDGTRIRVALPVAPERDRRGATS